MSKQSKSPKNVADERRAFVDATVIQLFARGWPEKGLFPQAERLWALRQAHIELEAANNSRTSAASQPSGTAGDSEAGK